VDFNSKAACMMTIQRTLEKCLYFQYFIKIVFFLIQYTYDFLTVNYKQFPVKFMKS